MKFGMLIAMNLLIENSRGAHMISFRELRNSRWRPKWPPCRKIMNISSLNWSRKLLFLCKHRFSGEQNPFYALPMDSHWNMMSQSKDNKYGKWFYYAAVLIILWMMVMVSFTGWCVIMTTLSYLDPFHFQITGGSLFAALFFWLFLDVKWMPCRGTLTAFSVCYFFLFRCRMNNMLFL